MRRRTWGGGTRTWMSAPVMNASSWSFDMLPDDFCKSEGLVAGTEAVNQSPPSLHWGREGRRPRQAGAATRGGSSGTGVNRVGSAERRGGLAGWSRAGNAVAPPPHWHEGHPQDRRERRRRRRDTPRNSAGAREGRTHVRADHKTTGGGR